MRSSSTACLHFLAVCAASLAGNARGEESDLGQVVVTATRTETDISDSPQSISVITREEIANGPDRTLPEILQRTTGVEVIQHGPVGSAALAQIRGSESEQVLILIDGRRIDDAQSGLFDLSDLPLAKDDIERIEILRGGASALYGSDAMGGVINIITRAPSREPHALASAFLGDFRTRETTFTHRWKPGAFGYGLSVSRQESLGFRPNSDLRSWVLGGELDYDLAPRSALGFSVRAIRKDIGTPGRSDNPDPDDRQRDFDVQLDLTFRTRLGSRVKLAVRGYQNLYRLTFDQGTAPDVGPAVTHRNYATGGEVESTAAIGDSQLLTAFLGGPLFLWLLRRAERPAQG